MEYGGDFAGPDLSFLCRRRILGRDGIVIEGERIASRVQDRPGQLLLHSFLFYLSGIRVSITEKVHDIVDKRALVLPIAQNFVDFGLAIDSGASSEVTLSWHGRKLR